MTELIEEGRDRIIIKLDPGGPVELTYLTASFSALARLYERHYRPEKEPAPKLYVTRLESGSVIAEIVPYAVILGAVVSTMDSSIIVSDFTRRIWAGIKAFSDPAMAPSKRGQPLAPSLDDAADIKTFMSPLAGRTGASLVIRHARIEQQHGDRKTVAEYTFDEAEINKATLKIDDAISIGDPMLLEALPNPSTSIRNEVMLFFEQASRKPGKESGRTGDRGIVPDVSDKSLPVYFRKSFQNLKDQMIKGEVNPLKCAFVVDIHVQYIDAEPKGYIVTNVHEVIQNDDGTAS